MINGNQFIALEGIDGSGKTTVCKILSKKINAEIYKTPSWPFSDLRDVIDNTVDIKSRFFFYLSSVIHASSEIARLLKHKHVVCDRYILSTLCYHRASESFLKSFDENQVGILQPDYTFFLNADYNIRMERIAIRGNADNSEVLNSDLHDKKCQDMIELEFSKYNNMLWINTNDILPEDVADIICEKIAL